MDENFDRVESVRAQILTEIESLLREFSEPSNPGLGHDSSVEELAKAIYHLSSALSLLPASA